MNLTSSNFVQYCANHYTNINCTSLEEFNEDIKRFQYLKKLFTRYSKNPSSKTCRLILNHIIIIFNIFTPKHGIKLLFLKLQDWYQYLVPFFVFMQVLPTSVQIEDRIIMTSDIPLNNSIVGHLRELNV